MNLTILLCPRALSCEQLVNPEQIPLASPEDREVQVGSEEIAHDVSSVCEPGDPEIVREPVDPGVVREPGDPEMGS